MSFRQIFSTLASGFSQFGWNDFIDIAVMAFLLYKLISWTRGTRAFEVLKGVGMLFLCVAFAQLLSLNTISWILESLLESGSIIIVLVILFTPEIRRVLEKLGTSGKAITKLFSTPDTEDVSALVDDLTSCFLRLSRRRVGALVVFERKTGLGDIMRTGTSIEGKVSGALLENIFEPNTPLHDGAVICRGPVISAAACFLPLSEEEVDRALGTRHRAALGVSAVADCIVIVVSEETGSISIAQEGRITRYISAANLKSILTGILLNQKDPQNLNAAKDKKEKKGENK